MSDDLLASLARVEAEGSMANFTSPPIPGRMLLVDGDALAYSCAGGDDTDPGRARQNVIDKVADAMRYSRAEKAAILLTMPGSHKGYRYAVARVKPYQGQRSGSRRPKNWSYLRELLENAKLPHPIVRTHTAEADDLFGRASTSLGHDNVVIYTEDKDMRMVPGWHLGWREPKLLKVEPATWELVDGEKTYGRKWFWLQMLHGDGADFVPGLPGYWPTLDAVKAKPLGPVTAAKFLDECAGEAEARAVTVGLYKGFYGDDWMDNIQEQAILLWMRRDAESSWMDVFAPGHPLAGFDPTQEIVTRITEAQALLEVPDCPND